MFVYLVNVFNAMPGGRIIGVVFFICVLFAGVSSIVNLYEAPIAFLQEQFKFKRAAAVGTIGVIGLIVSISIQPWTSQWMDVVSIYICPLGAALAGVMFFWVLSKKSARGSQQRRKEADRFLVLPAWQVRLHSAFPRGSCTWHHLRRYRLIHNNTTPPTCPFQ